MLRTRNHSRTTTQYVCQWCKNDITLDTPYATSAKMPGDLWPVGVLVCGPDCPAKPNANTVYLRRKV